MTIEDDIPPPTMPHQAGETRQVLAKRAAELEVVAQVSLATATILNSQSLLQTIVQLTYERFSLTAANVGLLTADGRDVVLVAAAGELTRVLESEHPVVQIDETPSLVAQAARTRKIVIANDVHQNPAFRPHPLLAETQSELVIPIIVGDRLIGVFDVQAQEKDRFGSDEVRIFSILAAQLGVALENAWRFEKIEKFTAELEDSRQFLHSIIDNIPTPLYVKDAQDLRLLHSNPANEHLVQTQGGESTGGGGIPLSKQPEWVQAKDDELLATGQPVEIPEQVIQNAAGEARILYTRKVPIKDGRGDLKYILGIAEDVTQQKRLEREIQASWERRGRQVQTITEVAQEIAAAPALNELFERVVELVQQRFGYYYVQVYILDGEALVLQAGSGLAGERLKAAGHNIPLSNKMSLMALAAQTREPVLVPDVRQEPRWLPNPLLPETRAEIAVPILLGQEVLGILDVQHDELAGLSTEDQLLLAGLCGQIAVFIDYRRLENQRARTEKQLKAYMAELEISNQELQEFAFVASHDLQEPLRKIQAFSDRLQMVYGSVLDERGLDYLERLRQASVRMQLLITDYLAFSRVAAMTFTCHETDLTAVAQSVVEDFQEVLAESEAEVIVHSLPLLEVEVSQMYLLFRHLLSNALKFRREGVPPVIQIEGEYLGEPADYCRLVVSDNGQGFDERYTDRIFRAFQQLHGRDRYEGTGMGLAICRKIVQRHHGHIDVQSRPGAGTIFTITLPLRHPEAAKP